MIDQFSEGRGILPNVRFYQKEVQNNYKTEMEGRPVFDMRDFVRIEIPGDRNNIIDTIASHNHITSYPQEWARYQNTLRDVDNKSLESGTPLTTWSLLTPAQARELRHFHFYTVEQVAEASDDNINKITMIIGMGGFAFRDKAREYLSASKETTSIKKQSVELHKRDLEIEALKKQISELSQVLQNDQVVQILNPPGSEETKSRGRAAAKQE